MRGLAALLALSLTAGCWGGGSGSTPVALVVEDSDFETHDAARFVASHADAEYRVNVRYIASLGRSVIAVREGAGDAGPDWTRIEVKAGATPSPGAPFADTSYRGVAIDIARAFERQALVCGGAETMELAIASDGDVRTLYRDDRQAWVVFAGCPGDVEGG